jgi:hypothetical protein
MKASSSQKITSQPQAASLATLAALGAAGLISQNVQANIVSTNLNATSSGTWNMIGFSYTNGVIGTDPGGGYIFGASPYYPGKGWGGQKSQAGGDYFNTPPTGNSQITAGPIALGSLIDSSSSWVDRDFFNQGNSFSYYGVRFNLGGGNYNYAWLQIATPGNSLTFGNAAVETAINTGISAGATTVPEPSTCALVALAGGACAVAALRRRRAV